MLNSLGQVELVLGEFQKGTSSQLEFVSFWHPTDFHNSIRGLQTFRASFAISLKVFCPLGL